MQSENKVFDDFVKMVNGFAGTFAGMGREAEASAREKMREWMGGQDFVGRDEFEAVKAMAAAARDDNEILKARIAALEAKVAGPAAGVSGTGTEQADCAIANHGNGLPVPASAATAPNQPVPSTSEAASRLGMRAASGWPWVATRVPSARGTHRYSAWAPFAPTGSTWAQRL